MVESYFDVVVVGSGAAGLCAALRLSENLRVALLCKDGLQSGATPYAQGGIAAVQAADDHMDSHIEDTMRAGDGICEYLAVKQTVENAPAAIQWLVQQGVDFNKASELDDSSEYHLHQEGGHSHRRILHIDDTTGRALSEVLVDRVKTHSNITVFENHVAVDLIIERGRCVGLYSYHESTEKVLSFSAPAIVLATGGASGVYLHTTSPVVSSGDGIAMAYRAGARVVNMEFTQFHPTCLYHPQSSPFLISEALRGEGAKLLLPDKTTFMSRFDERAELAPRDVVSRAIDFEMKRLGLKSVYLDISHRSSNFLQEHFPNIFERCMKVGIDISTQPIPVVPAAHYTCGGVKVNQFAQTDVLGLYAVGEVAYTGLHGANRMASNSLLECLVYAMAASDHITANHAKLDEDQCVSPWDDSRVLEPDLQIILSHNTDEVRRLMWNYVGIVRSDYKLQLAMKRLNLIEQEVQAYYSRYKVSRDLLELRNAVVVARLIVRSALLRKESRGIHYTVDYPDSSAQYAEPSVLSPDCVQSVPEVLG